MAFCGCKNGILALGLFGSGFASLGYQMVWTKQLGALFGLEATAILAIVAAYMGGLTAGALVAESAVLRWLSPIGRFAFLEWIIGLWGLVSYFGFPLLGRIPGLAGTGEGLPAMPAFFAAVFAALLPATLAMGAALPVAERVWRQKKPGKERVGWIYGVHTAGAAFGALATAFFLIPEFGLKASLGFLCGLSFLIAIAIFALRRQFPPNGESLAPKSAETPLPKRTFFTAFGLGFLGIAYQLLCVRVLSQTLENTVYTYASILSVYLAGASLGALFWQRLANRNPRAVGAAKERQRNELFRHGLLATALLILISLHAMAWIPAWHDALWPGISRGQARLLIVEVLVSALVLFLPAAAMGGLLSHLLQTSVRPRKGIGAALSGNLLGASLAPAVFVGLLPVLGVQRFLILISLAYAGLIPPQGLKARWLGIAALGVGLAAAPSPSKVLGLSTEEGRRSILWEGVSALVSVRTDADGHKTLQVNRRFQMGGTRAAADERRQAHLPLLLHPRPKRALFLGVGTGITLGAVLEHPQLRADAVELLAEVLQTLPEFAPHNHFPYPPGQIVLHHADARRFVRRAGNFYDVIIADVFHPARDGAGLLYTAEHYQNVRDRLADGGIFCQWLPLRQLDENTLKAIVRTFNAVFPHSGAWLLRDTVAVPVIGLIGAEFPLPISPERLAKALQNPTLRRALQECRLHSAERIFGSHLAGRSALERFSQSAPMNTDDNQYVASRAPLIRLGNPAPSILKTILRFQAQTASSLADDLPPGNLRQKMQTWFPSRDLYLLGLADEWAGNQTEAVHKFLQSLSVNKDFTASYAKCVSIAAQSLRSNPDFSRWLLSQLSRLKPEEPLAQKMLERLRG